MFDYYKSAQFKEDYEYFKKDLLKRKTQPFNMCNRELAFAYFEKFHEEFPTSRIFTLGGTQWICLDESAAAKLLLKIKSILKEQEVYLRSITCLVADIHLYIESTMK